MGHIIRFWSISRWAYLNSGGVSTSYTFRRSFELLAFVCRATTLRARPRLPWRSHACGWLHLDSCSRSFNWKCCISVSDAVQFACLCNLGCLCLARVSRCELWYSSLIWLHVDGVSGCHHSVPASWSFERMTLEHDAF